MKKIFSLFLLLSIVLTSGIVFADSAPIAFEYDAFVTNPNGTIIYEHGSDLDNYNEWYENGRLSYGVRVRVSYIEEHNGEQYTQIRNISTNDGKDFGYVLLKDLEKESPWSMSDFTFREESYEEIILNKDGVKIYEWPSKLEKVIGSIPYKTVIKIKKANQEGYWGYVTYNGVSGWIHSHNDDIADNYAEKILTTWRGAVICDLDNNTLGTIPPNTELNECYRTNTGKDMFGKYYVTYNGVSGYINFQSNFNDEIARYSISSQNEYTINYDGAVLIGTDNEIISIPNGTSVPIKAQGGDQYFTNYNGKDGWVFSSNSYIDDETITAETMIQKAKEIIDNNKNNPDTYNKSDNSIILNNYTNSTEISQVDDSIVSTIGGSNNIDSLSVPQIIAICISCAILGSIITAIIINCLNKKKNKGTVNDNK